MIAPTPTDLDYYAKYNALPTAAARAGALRASPMMADAVARCKVWDAAQARPMPADLYIDGPNVMPDDLYDPRWDMRGVYPMPRTPIVPTWQRQADGMRIGNAYFRDRWQDRWAKVGKPCKLLHQLFYDVGYALPFDLGFDPLDAPHLGVYYWHGSNSAAAFMREAMRLYYVDLCTDPSLLRPEAIVSDLELLPTTDLDVSWAGDWKDPATTQLARIRADKRFTDPKEWKGLGQSLALWMRTAGRGTLLNGQPIPPIDTHASPIANEDALQTMNSAIAYATSRAYWTGIGQPIAQALDIPYGEWQLSSNSRAHPVQRAPGVQRYNLCGDFPLGIQIPVNYCSLDGVMWDGYTAAQDGDSRWPTVDNWIKTWPGIATSAKPSRYEIWLRTVFAVQKANARAMHLSSPDVPLMPCIHADFAGAYNDDKMTPAGGNDGYDPLRRELMADYMHFCTVECGATRFWYWASEFDTNPVQRERVWKLVEAYRAKF